jgi:hypothetical protein
MAGKGVAKVAKVAKAVTAEGATPRPRAPRGSRPFEESQINAERAFRAAVRCGAADDFSAYRAAYTLNSRRRRAKLNDPQYLRERLRELEGEGPATVEVPFAGPHRFVV